MPGMCLFGFYCAIVVNWVACVTFIYPLHASSGFYTHKNNTLTIHTFHCHRRQRLKDSTAVRRDEFELENKCATAVDTLSTGLRTAIDQIWVRFFVSNFSVSLFECEDCNAGICIVRIAYSILPFSICCTSQVKEHLKERRIHEAASGRMERLEKSALIIWNKHAHLATGKI